MKATRKIFYLTPLCALLAAGAAHATNGMLMEGYGPISTGMGGASQAIDHGNAGMAQNPATLGLMADGTAGAGDLIGVRMDGDGMPVSYSAWVNRQRELCVPRFWRTVASNR